MSDISPADAARYLLSIKKAATSYDGFLDYYYPKFKRAGFQNQIVETLDLLEKDALIGRDKAPVRNVLITAPPRHAKSFYATLNYPAYLALRKPIRETMVGAYNAELAATFGRGTRDIVTSKAAAKPFPGFVLNRETRAVDFWKSYRKENEKEMGAYYAVGMGGTTTGRGANFLLIDDPYKTREEAESRTIRNKVWDFYAASLLTRVQPDIEGQPAVKVVTHTRWHPDDIGGRIMESEEFKNGEWIHLDFQALTTKNTSVYISRSDLPKDDPRFIPQVAEVNGTRKELMHHYVAPRDRIVRKKETLVALWPERFPVEWLLKQKKTIGDREFESLYQQRPYTLGGNIVKMDWFRRYTPETLPEEFVSIVIGLDTAFKDSQQNDYNAMVIGGVTAIGDIYILKVIREKMKYPALKKKVISVNAAWRGKGLRGWYAEDKASGQSLIQDLKTNSGVVMLPWKPGADDKVVRFNSVTPLIEGGRVYLPEEAEWLEDFEAEVVAFPAVKFDDQCDGFVIVLDVLSRTVIVGQQDFNAPIGQFAKQGKLQAELSFGGPLTADPKGWAGGAGGFGQALGDWKGWGES